MAIDIRTRQPLILPPEEEDEPLEPAEDILKQCLKNVGTIEQLLVLTTDKNGVIAFLGNCGGLAETLMFMELVKAQIVFSRVEGPTGDGGGLVC